MCVNFHVFIIRKGTYRGVDLDGSVFVLANLPRAPKQTPVANTLFIGTADSEKALAIEDIVKHLFGFSPPKTLRATIEYHESAATQELVIRGVLQYKLSFETLRPLSDEVSQDLYPWLSNPRQGIVKFVTYSPAGGKPIEYSNTNAISATFRMPTPSR